MDAKTRLRRVRLNVGLKVAAMVILFEVLMITAYTIVTNLILDEQTLTRVLNLSEQNLIAVVLIASLVLAGYLTYMVITRIFSPVTELTRGTEEIMSGNLDLKLEVKTGDELEVLAERFNAMAAALKAERASLENKVHERTKALEAAQRQEIERQADVLKLKDEFLFVAAHELRTPVTSIRWSLESVADRKMSEEIHLAFDDAMNASKNLATLVEDLLNMARLDARRIPFKKEFVNLTEAAQIAIKEMEPIAEKKKITLAFEAPEGLIPMALADERRVNEVLINLISNSVKYNRPGGHVTVMISRDEPYLRYDVVDDGPGIPPEEQRHLFEKFWRAKTSSGVEGSGLGLFITKRLVEGMNGIISFESEPGVRTAFTVRLPVAKS
ncbi:MAG TPA: HAMP domain-containing sensor histidine kinase [Candidatus Baltobacteraceae bacterium]|nr:HAMP domain-containing sensor histidine kinase [Candidatus Baltobacteraceae bacterium]